VADRAVGVPFAKEGIPFIAAPAGVTLLAGWLSWPIVAIGAALLTLFVAWFFRNPARVAPQGPRLVLAPGDGKVIAIEEEFEPRFLKDRSIRLTIFLNVFGSSAGSRNLVFFGIIPPTVILASPPMPVANLTTSDTLPDELRCSEQECTGSPITGGGGGGAEDPG